MTNKEPLELAAKAAGIEIVPYTWDKGAPWGEHEGFVVAYQGPDEWNPLYNDGQALRLAVQLNLTIGHDEVLRMCWIRQCGTFTGKYEAGEIWGTDKCAATRRAIVRAAAAIGASGSVAIEKSL